MREPALVADCMAAIMDATGAPATVKCRLGVDDQDPEEGCSPWSRLARAVGVRTFIVHARKAWLKGLSPGKENREIPPLGLPAGLSPESRAAGPDHRDQWRH